MKCFWIYSGVILLMLVGLFATFEWLSLPIFSPENLTQTKNLSTAVLLILLLMADVLFPVPASLTMIACGAIFGFALGTLVALCGGVLATLLAYAIGRQSRDWVANRFVDTDQLREAQHIFNRWGVIAIVATRPIPLLSETIAIVAGTSEMGPRQIFIASVAGNLPAALIYAWAGSTAMQLNSGLWSFGLVLLIAAIFWFLREPLNHLFMDDYATTEDALI